MAQVEVFAEDFNYYVSKKRKYLDFCLGFVSAALFWFLIFNPHYWYAGPILISLISGFALKMRVKRKYIAYGAIGLLFMPFAIWWSGLLFSMGAKEQLY